MKAWKSPGAKLSMSVRIYWQRLTLLQFADKMIKACPEGGKNGK